MQPTGPPFFSGAQHCLAGNVQRTHCAGAQQRHAALRPRRQTPTQGTRVVAAATTRRKAGTNPHGSAQQRLPQRGLGDKGLRHVSLAETHRWGGAPPPGPVSRRATGYGATLQNEAPANNSAGRTRSLERVMCGYGCCVSCISDPVASAEYGTFGVGSLVRQEASVAWAGDPYTYLTRPLAALR